MKPATKKILIGLGVAAAAFVGWKALGSPKPSPYEGFLVKGSANEIYFVEKGKLRYVPTIEVLNALKAQGALSQTLDDMTLNSIPMGESL